MWKRTNPIDVVLDLKKRRAGFNTINSTICEKYNDSIMTPTEKKAEEIENELFEKFSNVPFECNDEPISDSAVWKNCLISVENTIEALNSLKGMGKIQKVKLYKLVKQKLETK